MARAVTEPTIADVQAALAAVGNATREQALLAARFWSDVASGARRRLGVLEEALTAANNTIRDLVADRDYWRRVALQADPGLTPCPCGVPADAHPVDCGCGRSRDDVIEAAAS